MSARRSPLVSKSRGQGILLALALDIGRYVPAAEIRTLPHTHYLSYSPSHHQFSLPSPHTLSSSFLPSHHQTSLPPPNPALAVAISVSPPPCGPPLPIPYRDKASTQTALRVCISKTLHAPCSNSQFPIPNPKLQLQLQLPLEQHINALAFSTRRSSIQSLYTSSGVTVHHRLAPGCWLSYLSWWEGKPDATCSALIGTNGRRTSERASERTHSLALPAQSIIMTRGIAAGSPTKRRRGETYSMGNVRVVCVPLMMSPSIAVVCCTLPFVLALCCVCAVVLSCSVLEHV